MAFVFFHQKGFLIKPLIEAVDRYPLRMMMVKESFDKRVNKQIFLFTNCSKLQKLAKYF